MRFVRSFVICVLILAFGGAGLWVVGKKPEVPTREVDTSEQAVPVVTAEVKDWNLPFQLQLDGEAVTYRVVTVRAEVQGRIVKKAEKARGGTYVNKGDLLFEIDPTDYQLEIDRLKAQLLQADEEIKSVDVDLKNTARMIELAEEEKGLQQNHLNRMKSLQKRDTANTTQVEEAMMLELKARNALQTLVNQQELLNQQKKTRAANKALVQSQLNKAQSDLKRCTVLSPLEGRIVEDEVEEGDYLKPGEIFAHISDGARMEIKTKLRSEELAWVWQQHEVQNTLSDSLEGDPLNLPDVPCEVGFEFQGVETIWDGYISRLEGTGLDRDTRTFPCRVLVEEPRKTRFNESAAGAAISPPTLLSGMFVTVRIPVESPVPLLKLPLEAVRPGGQLWVKKDGKMEIRSVTLVHVEGTRALIRRDGSGLAAGDHVVISPLASVREGMPLKELKAEKKTDLTVARQSAEKEDPDKTAIPQESVQ